MSTPAWKVYNPQGEYIAACRHAEDAACLVACYGAGATIKYNHGRIVWREGGEEFLAGETYDFSAGESYDRAAAVMQERLKTR